MLNSFNGQLCFVFNTVSKVSNHPNTLNQSQKYVQVLYKNKIFCSLTLFTELVLSNYVSLLMCTLNITLRLKVMKGEQD